MPSCLAKLKHLSLHKSTLKLADNVKLENLQHLTLSGNDCIKKSLESFGKRLTGLRTLSLQFGKGCDLKFEDRYPLINRCLPDGIMLEQLDIKLFNDEKNYIFTAFFGENLTQMSKVTKVKMSGLSVDAYIQGF